MGALLFFITFLFRFITDNVRDLIIYSSAYKYVYIYIYVYIYTYININNTIFKFGSKKKKKKGDHVNY